MPLETCLIGFLSRLHNSEAWLFESHLTALIKIHNSRLEKAQLRCTAILLRALEKVYIGYGVP
jgi:hypothetical protein